jgi:hypothetical protein
MGKAFPNASGSWPHMDSRSEKRILQHAEPSYCHKGFVGIESLIGSKTKGFVLAIAAT